MHINRADYLAAHGTDVAVVLGNVAESSYEVVSLESCPLDAVTQADFTRRKLCYLATFAMIDGQFCQAFESPLPADAIVALAQNYAVFVIYKSATRSKPVGDGVDWLRKLMTLPDTRTEEN